MIWLAFIGGIAVGALAAYVIERVIEYRMWYGP